MRKLVVALAATFFLGLSYASAFEHPSFPWCGWYARHFIAAIDPGENFNRALEWLHWGKPMGYPCEGCLAIWHRGGPHSGLGHVGVIVGKCKGNICPIRSGNDGHGVRTRMRSVASAQFRLGRTRDSTYHQFAAAAKPQTYRLASSEDMTLMASTEDGNGNDGVVSNHTASSVHPEAVSAHRHRVHYAHYRHHRGRMAAMVWRGQSNSYNLNSTRLGMEHSI